MKCADLKKEEKRIKREDKFIKDAMNKHKENFNYSKLYYTNKDIKVTIICKKHNTTYLVTPRTHINTTPGGCQECKKDLKNNKKNKRKEVFLQKAVELYDDQFDYANIIYKSHRDSISIKCIKHNHTFNILPRSHIDYKFGGCSKCKINSEKEYWDIFLKKAKKKHDNKYKYKELNNKTPQIEVICVKHIHTFKTFPSTHLDYPSGDCDKCKHDNETITREKQGKIFIENAIKKHQNKFDYSNVEYMTVEDLTEIKCVKHNNKIMITPKSHLKYQNGGCNICKREWEAIYNTTKYQKTFVKKAQEIHENQFNYSEAQYKNDKTKIKIKCKNHGIFYSKPNNHLNSIFGGCLECKKKGGHNEIILKEGEILKNVTFKGFENIYMVTNTGRCFRKTTGKELLKRKINGYYSVSFEYNDEKLSVRMHQLVYSAFNDDYIRGGKKKVIDHIDENKLNNNINNLRYVTYSVNTKSAIDNGNTNMCKKKSIIMCDKNMIFLKKFEGINEAFQETKIRVSCIRKCLIGKNNDAGGFIWEYEDKKYNKYVKTMYIDDISKFVSIGILNGHDYSHYLINKEGVIVNTKFKNRKIKPFLQHDYFIINMCHNSKKKTGSQFYIHRLLGKCFLKNGDKHFNDKKLVINHIDEIKTNNNIYNLEWVTPRENTIHSIGKSVIQINKFFNTTLNVFNSIACACNYLGVKNNGNIAAVCKENNGRITAYGYKWRFVKDGIDC